MGEAFGGNGTPNSAQPQRGSYWKRNDSMRLVHLLLDADLKSAFIAAEGPQVRGQVDTSSLTAKQFWQLAAAKFNDDEWQPAHLFPNDAHLARCRAFTPTKKSKDVDQNYLRDKYKQLKKQFNSSIKRWEETCHNGNNTVDNFWKCSGVAPGTSDEGCWYLFLALYVGKHEQLQSVILEKQVVHQPQLTENRTLAPLSHSAAVGGSKKRARLQGFPDNLYDQGAPGPIPDLHKEMQMESLFKQQSEALKYVVMCYTHMNTGTEEEQRLFWRNSLATAQAQLAHIQTKLPSQPPPPQPQRSAAPNTPHDSLSTFN